jgi:hypothetical protein
VGRLLVQPADSAFLALSHLKLGHMEDALKYRAMFDEAMKLDEFKNDTDNQNFAKEIEEAFVPPQPPASSPPEEKIRKE